MGRRSRVRGRWWVLGLVVVLVSGLLVVVGAPVSAQLVLGRTERISVTDTGAEAAQGSFEPSVSANGRYVAFTTAASLDPLDGNDTDLDVYVRDRVTGKTVMLSRGQVTDEILAHGVGGPAASLHVASFAPGVSRREQPFGRARPAPGALVVTKLSEIQPDGESHSPSISADGRYVAFQTKASNITTADRDPSDDVIVVDRDPNGDGVFDERTPAGFVDYSYVTVGRRDYTPLGTRLFTGTHPSISADGTVVSWVQVLEKPTFRQARRQAPVAQDGVALAGTVVATVLRKGDGGRLDQPGVDQQYLDVTVGPPGYDVLSSGEPAVSADGRTVVATAQLRANGAVATDLAIIAVTVPDRRASRVDVMADGSPVSGPVGEPAVSGNGRMIAFKWFNPATAQPEVLVVDRDPDGNGRLSAAGSAEPSSLRVASRNVLGQPGGGLSPALSADGRYLAFVTFGRSMHNGIDATDNRGGCVAPNSTSVCDIVVRDLVTDGDRERLGLDRLPAELASPSLRHDCAPQLPADSVCEAGADSAGPALSASGDAVAYASAAADLVTADNNQVSDVFVRQFSPTMTSAPTSVDFGTVNLDKEQLATVAFDHGGFGPLAVGTVSITGPAAQDFDVFPGETCAGRTFHVTGTCVVSVRFKPTGTGVRTALLQLTTPAGILLAAASLTGAGDIEKTVLPVFDIGVDQDVLSFGDRAALTTSPSQAVVVRNLGTAPLTVADVGLQADPGIPAVTFPGDYTISAAGCRGRTLAVGTSCVITVSQTPRGTGSRPAVLVVTSNASTGARLIRLDGSGTAPILEVNPTVVRDGGVTTIRGKGFPPAQVIMVSAVGVAGGYTVTTDGQGTFAVAYVVFPNAESGIRRVDASFAGVSPPIAAGAEILVVPGSVAPPDFTQRR
ncbi:choice-of-anchor D domain-containing protein [Amycolatopsis sp. H20-H5]|uniref:choice-of-anchor D domain-containing protein n=1 Tax=Amycolatopsis sp. H20-H5 TaxID=3046309 RepID=UPI002DB98F30|nr:choice-of-anchor D domain-containing protein [Amycolatopsis sp. H20-H5]MEC3978747.1 choice-of-anchor D domain-containing protein [Amycolatopsis sp. H20-H5]